MFSVIGKKNNQSSVSESVREIPTSGLRIMPEICLILFSAFLCILGLGFSRSVSDTDSKFYLVRVPIRLGCLTIYLKQLRLLLLLCCCCSTFMVNSHGHVRTVS